MSNYVIFTESACDIKQDTLKEWGVKYCALSFTFSGDEKQYSNYDLTAKEFYQKMRDGATAKTSAANTEVFVDIFEINQQFFEFFLFLCFFFFYNFLKNKKYDRSKNRYFNSIISGNYLIRKNVFPFCFYSFFF